MKMNLKGIKLVTFDITHTLLNFRVPPWKYYTIVAKQYGFQGSDDAIKDTYSDNMKLLWKKYPNFGKTSILWEEWWTQLVKMNLKDYMPATTDFNGLARKIIDDYRTDKCWVIAKDADKLINHLRKHNVTIGIISNFDPRIHEILRCINWDKKFNFVLASYDVGYMKPDKMIFMKALDMGQNIKPSQAMHVGDDVEKDYNGARAAGWHAVLINPKVNPETPPAPQHVFSSIEDLHATIEQEKLTL